ALPERRLTHPIQSGRNLVWERAACKAGVWGLHQRQLATEHGPVAARVHQVNVSEVPDSGPREVAAARVNVRPVAQIAAGGEPVQVGPRGQSGRTFDELTPE